MSQPPQFEHKDGAILLDGEKIANYSEESGLRMLKGQGEHKEAVKDFLGLNEEEEEDTSVIVKPKAKEGNFIVLDPICPIPCDPSMGDKTPAIVDWWFEKHPELAAKKYAGRKINR